MKNKLTHRANERLKHFKIDYRFAIEALEDTRIIESIKKADTPIYSYISYENYLSSAVQTYKEEFGKNIGLDDFSGDKQLTSAFFNVTYTMALWSRTQGIYRFDKEIYNAILEGEPPKDIPCDLLKRLPEWCVYIETPDDFYLNRDFGVKTKILGFWTCIVHTKLGDVLSIIIDNEDVALDSVVLGAFQIELYENNDINNSKKTIDEKIQELLDGNKHNNQNNNNQTISILKNMISLLLYLCADRELTYKGKIDEPVLPKITKTKKGLKEFANPNSKVWEVGIRLGRFIREARETAYNKSNGDGTRTVRPHIRKAHFNTFFSGKKKDEFGNIIPNEQRIRNLKWLPPVFVNANKDFEIDTVIKKVK